MRLYNKYGNGHSIRAKGVCIKKGQSNINQTPFIPSGFSEAAVARNGQAIFKANLLDKPYTKYELAKQIRVFLDS